MKKTLMVCLVSFLLVGLFSDGVKSRFAEDPRTGFASTASRQSTMYTMGNEADSIHAKGIVDIARPFFSAGYLGNSGLWMSNNMQATWAVPINEDVSLGMVGNFIFDVIGNSSSGVDVRKDTTTFNVRLAASYDTWGFHYRIAKAGLVSNIPESSATNWEHEIGLSYKNPGIFNFYSPLGVIIDDSYKASFFRESGFDFQEKANAISYYMFPQFEFPLSFGPVTAARFGINVVTDIYSFGNSVIRRINTATDAVTDYTFTNRTNFVLGFDYGATLMWPKEKIVVIAEPYGGFDYAHRKQKEVSTSNDIKINSPDSYLGLNIGILVKPISWFEFRAGLLYKMDWDNTHVSIYNPSTNTTTKEDYYIFSSTFGASFGVGFILAEDFIVDIHVDPMAVINGSIASFKNFGITALYRF